MFAWVLAGCALGKLGSIGKSYPVMDGEREVASARESLWIGRDGFGVPHVRARSDEDAWYGLGFAHGQDRLFQADLSRHVAFGALAPWVGEKAVPVDLFAQGLGLRALARAEYERLDPETRAMLDAYARGINDASRDRERLPIEYRLLNADFEEWKPEDCLAVVYLMAWGLADNLRYELAAWELRDLPPDVLDRVLRTAPEDPPIDGYWDQLRTATTGSYTPEFAAYATLLGGLPALGHPAPPAASNNWVIAGEHTADGLPIVANDPHLTQSVPSLWYAADVSGASFHAAGATLPGVPGFPVGHSIHAAWGLTNVMADQVDVVVLERKGDGYVLGGEVVPFEPVPVATSVKGEAVTGTVYRTRVGPVMTAMDAPYVLALRWSTLETPDVLPQLLRRLAGADTVDAIVAGSHGEPLVVALNMVMADDSGDYAWQTVGSMVRRKAHTGRVPYPGGDPAMGWDGFHVDIPGNHREPGGYWATANDRPADPLASALSTTYVAPHRIDRIRELLAEAPVHDVATENRIQTDRQDGDARVWLPQLMAGVAPTTDEGKRCAELLNAWDLVADRDSVAASVWAVFLSEYEDVALTPELTADQRAVVASVSVSGQNPLDAGTLLGFSQDRPADVALALDRTCHALAQRLGDDPSGWNWGALHPLVLKHPFSSNAPRLLKSWNMRPVPYGGTGATVAAAGHPLGTNGVLPVGGMASLRVVMPLGDLGASTLVHPGGQSGQPGSLHYASHYVSFVDDATVPLWFDDRDLDHVTDRLTLRPAR